MSIQTIRVRSLTPARRARATRLGGEGEIHHLDLLLLTTLAVSAMLAVTILVARSLAAVG